MFYIHKYVQRLKKWCQQKKKKGLQLMLLTNRHVLAHRNTENMKKFRWAAPVTVGVNWVHQYRSMSSKQVTDKMKKNGRL